MDIRDRLTETLSLQTPTGTTSSYGDPSWGSVVTAAARVEPTSRRVTGPDGTLTQATHRLFITPDVDVSIACRIFLPGVSTSSGALARRPVQVSELKDLDGVRTHWEVYL